MKRFEFNYELNYKVFPRRESLKGSIKPFTSNLNLYYEGLLKIRELASQGLSKEFSEKNIVHFIDWMDSDLNVMLGLEFSLALEIFGGNTKLLTMISIGSNSEQTKKRLWGTAWDLFHARMSCNRPQISRMVGRETDPIFVTKDYALFKIMAPSVLHGIRFNSTMFKITQSNEYPHHYSREFMDKLNEKLLRLSVDRVSEKIDIDDSNVLSIIKSLESNLE
ncbi:hypothetical protein [Wandonia haliotis]|uniref:hypothetical protein n=1 Tax=Wandonia haliotis TaxID=574963 RepID=UPI0031D05A3A